MKLNRTSFEEDGIFGDLTQDDGTHIAETLEHAFLQNDGSYAPKLNEGTHTCVLGEHELDHGGPFQAYEITGVPGHSGILFHVGNYNTDSNGCVLLGELRLGPMITNSKVTFDAFMALTNGANSFELVVTDSN